MAHPHPHTRNKTERRTSNESYVFTYVCLYVCVWWRTINLSSAAMRARARAERTLLRVSSHQLYFCPFIISTTGYGCVTMLRVMATRTRVNDPRRKLKGT